MKTHLKIERKTQEKIATKQIRERFVQRRTQKIPNDNLLRYTFQPYAEIIKKFTTHASHSHTAEEEEGIE